MTKYNPRFRDVRGAYTRPDWSSFSDIGDTFSGSVLTLEEYERVESAYVSTATSMLAEAGVASLKVVDLEAYGNEQPDFRDTTLLTLNEAACICRDVLRDRYWCRLVAEASFIHFGHDYYMYVGCPKRPSRSIEQAARLGLFVEEFESPYGSQ